MRRRALAVAAVLSALLLTGCTEQGAQWNGDSISPPGTGVTEWRDPTGPPIVFSGPTVGGASFSSAEHRGDVLVVNFWYQNCGPCNSEARSLQAIAAKYSTKDVQFVGINTADGAGDAQAFQRQYAITYPSILDQSNRGAARLAFAGSIAPNAIPSTLVLDEHGRVTARIVGEIDSSTLSTLIDSVLDGRDA